RDGPLRDAGGDCERCGVCVLAESKLDYGRVHQRRRRSVAEQYLVVVARQLAAFVLIGVLVSLSCRSGGKHIPSSTVAPTVTTTSSSTPPTAPSAVASSEPATSSIEGALAYPSSAIPP